MLLKTCFLADPGGLQPGWKVHFGTTLVCPFMLCSMTYPSFHIFSHLRFHLQPRPSAVICSAAFLDRYYLSSLSHTSSVILSIYTFLPLGCVLSSPETYLFQQDPLPIHTFKQPRLDGSCAPVRLLPVGLVTTQTKADLDASPVRPCPLLSFSCGRHHYPLACLH